MSRFCLPFHFARILIRIRFAPPTLFVPLRLTSDAIDARRNADVAQLLLATVLGVAPSAANDDAPEMAVWRSELAGARAWLRSAAENEELALAARQLAALNALDAQLYAFATKQCETQLVALRREFHRIGAGGAEVRTDSELDTDAHDRIERCAQRNAAEGEEAARGSLSSAQRGLRGAPVLRAAGASASVSVRTAVDAAGLDVWAVSLQRIARRSSSLEAHWSAAGLEVSLFPAVDASAHATKHAMARASGLPELMCLDPECGTCHVRHAAVYFSHVLLLREIACRERTRRAWSLILEDDARMNKRVSAAQLRAFLAHETESDIVFFNRGNCRPGGVVHCGYGLYGYAIRRAAAISLAVYLTPGSPFLSTNAERDAEAKPCLIDWEMCLAIEKLGLVATCPSWTAEHGEWIEVDAVEQAKSTVSCRGAQSIAVGCDGAG